ncbi:SusC/RagA family TonB-linked outer membrane protein [Thalassobellus sediminis]|uniref:SusC/RagA family TonB-linked outer membrane protein n=1 Tax=Thalassobellus sediminis TaxID=3367753 RepID=UPI00379D1317
MKTKKNIKYYFFLLGMLLCLPIYAQNASDINGTVSDESGMPLPGVSVIIKNTTTGTATDFDGNYTLKASSDAILVFSYLGYTSQEVSVNGKSTINITLVEEAGLLDEVVVVGYGSVKRTDLTGSVTSISTEEITQRSVNNPLEAIQGNLPGVVITNNTGRLGDGFNVNIRGINTFNTDRADQQPLYIVDGVPTDNIEFLNPQDIAQIDVLKDASSAAIYGSRGANGVVIVTTKSGTTAKSGVNVSFESSYGIVKTARLPEFMTGAEWWAYHQTAYLSRDPLAQTPAQNFTLASNNSPELVKRANAGFEFDWADAVLRDGVLQNNYISVAGRAENGLAYNIAIGVQNDEGQLQKESRDNYTFKAGVSHNINDKFSAGINLTIAHEINQLGSGQAMRDALRLSPLTSPWAIDADGNQLVGELWAQPGKLKYPNGDWAFNKTSTRNPLVEIANSSDERRRWRTLANMFLEYKALDWLSFKTSFSAGQGSVRRGRAYGVDSYAGGGNGINSSIDNSENFNYTWDNQFNINYTINEDHVFSFLGLQSLYSNRTETSFLSSRNQTFESDWYNIGSGLPSTFINKSGFRKNTLSSYAARLNYSYQDKYLLTASNRWDGSSVLSAGNKWDFFPSVALAWKLSNESFLNNNSFISNLKARASIGYTGNDNVDPYTTLNGVPTQTYYDFDGNDANGNIADQLANKNLTWEKTRELNFGIDFGFLNQRISGSIDVYDRLSKDLILEQVLPIETGAGKVNNNIGDISNKGIEIALLTRNIQTDKVTWTTNFSFSKNKNEVISFYGQSEVDDPGNGLFVGKPYRPHYNYLFDGVWQADQAAEAAVYGMNEGEAIAKDINNDGKIDPDDDRIILGTEQPDWIAGLTSNLTVGNFDLSISAIAMQGVLVKSDFLNDSFGDPNDRGRQHLAWDSYYVPVNSAGLPAQVSNEVPRPRGQGQFWGTDFGFYRDASFVKIKNIALGYSLNDQILDKLKIKSLRIYANILNPFVFANKDFEGWEPEWAAADQNVARPSSVTYQLGLSLKL